MVLHCNRLVGLCWCLVLAGCVTQAFVCPSPRRLSTTTLFGKGFRSAQHKQSTLRQKLELAKKQQPNQSSTKGEALDDGTSSLKKSEEDASRAEFARLLAENTQSMPRNNEGGFATMGGRNTGGGPYDNVLKYKKKKKVAKDLPKNSKPADKRRQRDEDENEPSSLPVCVGDKARRSHFEPLIPVDGQGQAWGPVRTAQFLPWIPPFWTDALVILADPRRQSSDLKLSAQYLYQQQQRQNLATTPNKKKKKRNKSKTGRIHYLVVSADRSLKETQAWMAQGQISNDDNFVVCLDSPNLDWMTQYGCVGGGWSLHLLVIDNNGIVQVHKTEGIQPSTVCQAVTDALASLETSNN